MGTPRRVVADATADRATTSQSSEEALNVGTSSAPAVLIVNENESVPHDRRVWQEALALVRAGYSVSVICPRGEDEERSAFEERKGVQIHRYQARPAAGSSLSYVREYGWALIQISRLVSRLSRRHRFAVVHVCNPPDVLGIATLPMKLRGSASIFDHHDLVPELYLSRFGGKRDALYWLTVVLERFAFALADVSIATNESYRQIALDRGRKHASDVFVVRNDPDLSRFRPREPDPALRRGKPLLIAYAGVMGPQDGVDHAIRALALLRERRDDWHAAFAGDGDLVEEMRALALDLGLADSVEFLGWLRDDQLLSLLSTADVCLAPEPRNPLNEVSTMVKVLEYMAMARPIISYDLAESLVSAGDAALFATSGDVGAFAARIEDLLDDPSLRARLSRAARMRVEQSFSWQKSETSLLEAYDRARKKRGEHRGWPTPSLNWPFARRHPH